MQNRQTATRPTTWVALAGRCAGMGRVLFSRRSPLAEPEFHRRTLPARDEVARLYPCKSKELLGFIGFLGCFRVAPENQPPLSNSELISWFNSFKCSS